MKKAYKYGIELECVIQEPHYREFREKVNSRGAFRIDSDASVHGADYNDMGMEIKSAHAMSFTELSRALPELVKLCDIHNVSVNKTCGFHVHVSNKRFDNPKILKKLVYTWCAVEDVFFSTQPQSRLGNRYCKRKMRDFIAGEDIPKEKHQLLNYTRGIDRYYALNLASMARHKTVEIRLHSGTVNKTKILNWVRLVQSFYDYVLSEYDHTEVTNLFTMPISEDKVKRFFNTIKATADIVQFYTERTQKYMYPQLAEQQSRAVQALAMKPTVDKVTKKFKKTQNEYSTVRERYDRLLSNIGQ